MRCSIAIFGCGVAPSKLRVRRCFHCDEREGHQARAVRAQQTDHMRRLGVLFSITEADSEGQARVAALKLGLLEHGWIEGRNLEINYRWGSGESTQLQAYAAELTALNLDVIFAAPRDLGRVAAWPRLNIQVHASGDS
jgi:hypothetical protein